MLKPALHTQGAKLLNTGSYNPLEKAGTEEGGISAQVLLGSWPEDFIVEDKI